MAKEACATDILVDLSVPKVTPKKRAAAAQNLLAPKQSTSSWLLANDACLTGLLVDLDELTPPSERKEKQTLDDCTAGTPFRHVNGSSLERPDPFITSVSDSFILDFDGLNGITCDLKDESMDLNVAGDQRSELGPLSACQMAEIFEQANTVAVRIELANNKRPATGLPSGDGGVVESRLSPDASPSETFSTSTPSEKVAFGVDIHFLGVESANTRIEDSTNRPKLVEPGRRVTRTGSLKQPVSLDKKTAFGYTPSRPPLRGPPVKAASSKVTSGAHAKSSTESSALSDSSAPTRVSKSRASLSTHHFDPPEEKRKKRVSEALARPSGRNSPSVVPPSSGKLSKAEFRSKAGVRMTTPVVKSARTVGKENVDGETVRSALRPTVQSRLPSKTSLPRNVFSSKSQAK